MEQDVTAILQKLDGNGRTRFGIRKRMMMVLQIIAAGSRNGLKLMVGQHPAEMPPGSSQSVKENIVRIIHPINLMDSFQTSLIETRIMCHKRQSANQGTNLFPDQGKYSRRIRLLLRKAVYPVAEITVVFRLRPDK